MLWHGVHRASSLLGEAILCQLAPAINSDCQMIASRSVTAPSSVLHELGVVQNDLHDTKRRLFAAGRGDVVADFGAHMRYTGQDASHKSRLGVQLKSLLAIALMILIDSRLCAMEMQENGWTLIGWPVNTVM